MRVQQALLQTLVMQMRQAALPLLKRVARVRVKVPVRVLVKVAVRLTVLVMNLMIQAQRVQMKVKIVVMDLTHQVHQTPSQQKILV